MATRSTIMDTNSFRPEMAAALDPETRKLTEERDVLGPAYRLFYRNPVHLVKAVARIFGMPTARNTWTCTTMSHPSATVTRAWWMHLPSRLDAQHPHALPA